MTPSKMGKTKNLIFYSLSNGWVEFWAEPMKFLVDMLNHTHRLRIIFITPIPNFQSLVKTWTLNTSTSGLITKEKSSKFLTLHLPFCPFLSEKKYSHCMVILSTLESTSLDETIRCASKWFIFAS